MPNTTLDSLNDRIHVWNADQNRIDETTLYYAVKSVLTGNAVTANNGTGKIAINTSMGIPGSGTVTSVAISGAAGGITVTGSPITSAGTISLKIANTAVLPGTYGTATAVPRLTVAADGRVTAVTEVDIAYSGGGGGGGTVVTEDPIFGDGVNTPIHIADSSTTQRGSIRCATQSEANAGVLANVAITPATLKGVLTAQYGIGAYIFCIGSMSILANFIVGNTYAGSYLPNAGAPMGLTGTWRCLLATNIVQNTSIYSSFDTDRLLYVFIRIA
jgi:hypothetical protein